MRIRTLIPILTTMLVLLAVGATPVLADAFGCQIPLFVQQGSIDANVMVLFDNSGSMNAAMLHTDFEVSTVYDGPFVETKTYYVGTSKDYAPNQISGRPAGASESSPTAPLVKGYMQNGRYRGNYLNWIFYHATDEQRATLPQWTRMDVAHVVVSDIIQRSERVRFGLTKFNTSAAGQVIAECGTDEATLLNKVNTLQGTTWTPLGETMETILNYFKKTDASAPIVADCQKNFCIVITDGYPTKDTSVSGYLWDADNDGNDPGNCTSIGSPDANSYDCSDHLDDVAYYMRHNDLRGDLDDDQDVISYTIGFGVDANILYDTAINGDGLYLMAEDAVDLWTSLELVMVDIISRISTGAAVAVVSTERGDEERLYRGKFLPSNWHGYLEAFTLPYEDGDHPIWEAGAILAARNPSSREIFTAIGSTEYPFTVGSATSLTSAMNLADSGETADIIEWTRGDYVTDLRDREGRKLGDVIHSTPVVVGAPSNFTEDESYQNFMTLHENREKMVYVGANDGMLHCFESETGDERWAFVPEFALPILPTIADTSYCHSYSVDLTPSVRDCKIGTQWKTILVGGGRQGGASYFALDVTYPSSPSVLWQVTLPGDKPFASMVEFAVIQEKPMVLIGSGLDESTGLASLEVYDVENGAHWGTVSLATDASRRNKATGARAVDTDLDGNHDVAYVADMLGHVWKLRFNGSPNPASWDQYCLWADTSVEITSPPMPAYAEGGAMNIYFGTGAYVDEADIATREDNIFCCIFDKNDNREYLNLTDQTNNINDLTSGDGWYIRLENIDGERVTEPAAVVAGSVFFTSFVPSQEICDAGGNSWLYRMDYGNGSVPDDGEDDNWEGNRSVDLGQGVASRPVVDIVNETVIVQSSDATITVQAIGQSYFHLMVKAWQENFDYVSVPSGD